MPQTPQYTLAHLFLPNMVKLKGAMTVVSAIERKDLIYFDPLWQQAYITHHPYLTNVTRSPWRVGVISLPTPKEMGEAYMAAIVLKADDVSYVRYFTLELDYVLKAGKNRTLVCEREGQKHIKHGEGPDLSGDAAADAEKFIDAVMAVVVPIAKPR